MEVKKMKKHYKTPHVHLVKVQMEVDIALGSAKVYPQNGNNVVQDQWTEEDDDNRNIDW